MLAHEALLTLQRHAEINASWDAPVNEIVEDRDVNLGIAVVSPHGLIIPNIGAAQKMPFGELARWLNALTAAARENKTARERIEGMLADVARLLEGPQLALAW